jgi:hypothetical protein
VRESLGFEGKGLKGFAFSGPFRSKEMASWQLALRGSGLRNVRQAASLPIRSAVLDSLFKDRGSTELAEVRHKASGS